MYEMASSLFRYSYMSNRCGFSELQIILIASSFVTLGSTFLPRIDFCENQKLYFYCQIFFLHDNRSTLYLPATPGARGPSGGAACRASSQLIRARSLLAYTRALYQCIEALVAARRSILAYETALFIS